jgi:hypothetical protein
MTEMLTSAEPHARLSNFVARRGDPSHEIRNPKGVGQRMKRFSI